MSGTISGEKTFVYIVDSGYRLIYANDLLKEVFPNLKLGEVCYHALCHDEQPCEGCPLSADKQGGTILYNKWRRQWIGVSAGEIDWPGAGPCYAVLGREIQEDNKSLFYNLTSITAYDELFELNLSNDTYKILYHMEGKYVVPAPEGVLSSMMQEVTESMIHPEDKEAFERFWDLDSLFLRLAEHSQGGPMTGDFRKKKMDGDWCWVRQTVVPLRQGFNDDKIAMCFIQDINGQKLREIEKKKELGASYILFDTLTGLYRKQAFFEKTEEILRQDAGQEYCLAAIDIEHFKLFNEWHGRQSGDEFLGDIASCLKEAEEKCAGAAGYFGDDDFCVLLPDRPELLDSLYKKLLEKARRYGNNAGFLPAFGVYHIIERTAPAATMYDRACIAMNQVKGNYASRVCQYNEGMIRKMEEEHILLSDVQKALERREFIFYLQPQCNMATGRIVGLESLVRWNHPEKGIISPGGFIPLLEKNGFIADLDRYIWSEVCRHISRWVKNGHRAVPVSVNVSRVDIYSMDVPACFQELANQYELDPSLIEVEITESAYAEDYQLIRGVAERLRESGFSVLMDDFGSGYSSLNMLKDVNVDVLKIDMKFLDMDGQSSDRGVGILAAVVNMARMMEIKIIAEGVETEEQMKFLLNIGCFYGQGYYFYRPMPIQETEKLLLNEDNIDFRGIRAGQIKSFQSRELLSQDVFSETMLNHILGAIAVFEVWDNKVVLVRINEQYCQVMGENPVDLGEGGKSFLDYVYQDDQNTLLDIFSRAHQNNFYGADGELRYLKNSGETLWIRIKAFYLGEQDGHRLYYSGITDITEFRHREQMLKSSQRALNAVVHISENNESFMKLTETNRRIAASIFAQMSPGGMIGGYCEEGFPLYFANAEMVKLLGYGGYDEFAEAIGYKAINTIHPDDRETVTKDIGSEYYPGLEYTTTYRMPRKDGTWFWTLDKGKVIEAEDGRLAIVSACTDISETMEVQQELAARNALLLKNNQELNFLNQDMPGGYYRCADTPGHDFLYVSERFLEILDYTREELRTLFDNKYLNMVHPDDRSKVDDGTKSPETNSGIQTLEYRMLSKSGYIWVIAQSKYLKYRDKLSLQGIVLDVTETVELRTRMGFLMKYSPENIVLLQREGDCFTSRVIAAGLFCDYDYAAEEYERDLNEGRFCYRIFPDDFTKVKDTIIESMQLGKNYQDQLRLVCPGGQILWVSLDARCISRDEQHISYLCILRDMTEARLREQELKTERRKMESILWLAGISSWEWDMKQHTLVLLNAEKNGAMPHDSRAGRIVINDFPDAACLLSYIPAEYRKRFASYVERVRNSTDQEKLEVEFPVQKKDGSTVWLRISGETLCGKEGSPVRAVGYYTDITEEKKESTERKENRKVLELLRGQVIYDFMVNVTNNSITVEKGGSPWQKETGCESTVFTEVVEFISGHLVLPKYRQKFKRFADRDKLLKLSGDGHMESLDYQRLYEGKPHWLRIIMHTARLEETQDIFAYIFVMDIHAQKLQELKLTRMAETDALTGLYNRHTAIPRIETYLKEMEETGALIMLDLDNFKMANDVFGHAYGDSMLTQTAGKLKHFFHEEDIVCRIGGDEFLVLCKDICEKDVDQKLSEVVDALVMVYSNQGKEELFSISAGYVMAPEHGRKFKELYSKADIALFHAKMSGKNSFQRYEPTMKAVRYELAKETDGE